jgi:putative tricarboxylic transport membrane protein
MRVGDAVSGALVLALGIAMIVIAAGFPGFPGQRFGPSLFPTILGVGLAGCGALLALRGLRETPRAPLLRLDAGLTTARGLLGFALALGGAGLFAAVGERVGFAPISLGTLLALMVVLGVRPLHAAALSVLVTGAIHGFFAELLRVPLPLGWLA